MPLVGVLEIGENFLVAQLPRSQPPRLLNSYTRFDSLIDRLTDVRCRLLGTPKVPTLMHFTHPKAASTWINNILGLLFRDRCAPRGRLVARATGGDFSKHVFESGWVYRAMLMSYEDFLSHDELRGIKRFVVIRDLRDTLVSLYFSLKVSHVLEGQPSVQQERETLSKLETEEGFLHLIHGQLKGAADFQASWLGKDEIVLRYEDLLVNPLLILEDVLIERLEMPVSLAALDRAIRRTHFETVYKRKLGEEDVSSHGRKGVPGDWKNHFTPEIRRQFVAKYGQLLIDTGYEKDWSWADR